MKNYPNPEKFEVSYSYECGRHGWLIDSDYLAKIYDKVMSMFGIPDSEH